ncbi:protein kinase domain-containing protein [Eubacterium aggregans]|uniref:protein kinase domain-containing protein n=1 Tax=Eubacterium aggregans TaxID=81409 RepID=UPI003F37418B
MWAIKELNKQGNILDFNRQYHEAELLAELNHPGMPRVAQFFDDEQASYIVMDYIGGESLAEIMKEGLIDEARIKEWLPSIIDILSYLHGKGYVYMDLKPANFIASGHQIKMIDFGAIIKVGDTSTDRAVTNGFAAP